MGILLLGGLVAALIFLSRRYFRRRRLHYPPGPKGLPFIGNVLDIPRGGRGWLTYERWGREHDSDIISLRIFGISIIILNSAKATYELLGRRSSIYSDRQRLAMLHDFVGWDKSLVFAGYGEDWREHHRVFHEAFQGRAIREYHPKMSKEAKKLLPRLLTTDDFRQTLRTTTAAVILGVTFGMDIKDHSDSYVVLAEKAIRSIVAVALPGTYMVDYMPLMRWIPSWAPGGEFKREAAEWSALVSDMFTTPLELVKTALRAGTASPCVAATLLDRLDERKDKSEHERYIRNVTGTAYVAAADTTPSALGTFMLAMVMNPAIQRAAQEQIDRVVGQNSLPEFADREHLPYINAILYEVLRWRPVAPLGIPHKLTVDDDYQGYHIPAGSIVVGNTWAILHDSDRFPDPDTFDPTRWLTPDGKLSDNWQDAMTAFGYGRRMCPGRNFAMESMWINMAHILAVYDIEKPVDEYGRPIEPSGEYTSGLLTYPVPFKVVFKPRSAAAFNLIQADLDD
ncbi:cytochrome P450 [Phanerochaete sordida]|uniref:Cytochrome P450 n=1 Tax=Phanerochaete sordida TaxID=48140 RepID=A0A9P3GM10_9APHY|nr:cytochrome P450 [Phanerochaete sordida]